MLRRGALILGLLSLLLGMGLLAAPTGTLAAPPRVPANAPLRQACDNPPDQSATVTPKCGPKGTIFQVTVMGFTPNEGLSFWFTDPHGNVIGTANPLNVNHGSNITLPVDTSQDIVQGVSFTDGVWALTFQGASSNHTAVGRFRVGAVSAPAPTQPAGNCDNPPDQSATVTPKCGPKGTVFQVTVTGFTPNEPLSFWFTDPHGNVIGTARPLNVSHGSDVTLPVDTSQDIIQGVGFTDGIWALTFQGAQSNHTAIGRFRVGNAPAQATAVPPTDTPAAPPPTTVPATDTPAPPPPTEAPATDTPAPLPPTEAPPTDTPAPAPPTAAPPPPTDTPAPAPPTAAPPPPTQPPVIAPPPTEVPTEVPTATSTPVSAVTPVPGMPRTGAGESPWAWLLILFGALLTGGALITRRRWAAPDA